MISLSSQQAAAVLAAVSPAGSPLPEPPREFIFGEPQWFWALLLLIPLLLLCRRRGAASCIAHPTVRFAAARMRRPARLAGRLGPLLFCLAAACIIAALARPQWRSEHSEQKVSGIDIMIACDLSGSMSATDMLFTQRDNRGRMQQVACDRLTAARHVMNNFIASRPNDRLGLIAFAGKAKLCSPLTLDHALLRHVIDRFYLSTVDMHGNVVAPGYIREDGTAIGTAIASAATRLEERRDTKSKVIILVTDGVNNRGAISPLEAAEMAAKLDIRIFTIAIGRHEPVSTHTADVNTIDEKTLREIARVTGGRYYLANSGNKLSKAFDNIDKLEKTDASRRRIISYKELFIWPLALACLLLTLGSLLTFTRPQPAP